MVGDGAATLVARAFGAAGVPQPPEALERFLAIYAAHELAHTRPYPQVREVLAALAPRAALAILTNKPVAATRRILDGLELGQYFSPEAVIGGDGPFPRKPDPGGLLSLLKSAGTSRLNTLLVGDSIIDWHTARNAGVSICLARYGFGFENFPAVEWAAGELAIDTPADLLSL